MSRDLGSGDGVRVLGVDPGLTRCGFAGCSLAGRRVALIRGGFVRTPPGADPANGCSASPRPARTGSTGSARTCSRGTVFQPAQRPTVMGTAQAAGVVVPGAARQDPGGRCHPRAR